MIEPKQRYYSGNILVMLIVGAIISIALFISGISADIGTSQSSFMGLSQVGLLMLCIEIGCLMVYDWRGIVTLRGAVKTHIIHKGQSVSTAASYFLLYLFFPYIMLPIYLVRVTIDFHRAKQLKPLETRHKIAIMEAQLGILPPTEGTCRACQKPLLIGAEFCQYCGETVVEKPKVCYVCATTALPDAKWCPKCRAALDVVS